MLVTISKEQYVFKLIGLTKDLGQLLKKKNTWKISKTLYHEGKVKNLRVSKEGKENQQ